MPSDAITWPVTRSHRCPAIVVDPMSRASPYPLSRPLVPVAGPDAQQPLPPAHRHRDLPVPVAQRCLELLDHPQVTGEVRQAPLRLQGQLHPAQIARWLVQYRRRHLDVEQPNGGVDQDVPGLGPLADDLLVHLALGRHVHHQIAQDTGLATQPAPRLQGLAPRIALLGLARRAQGRCG